MNVLVVAAHPDDEALGCGGAMARHAAEGDQVHVLFLADGVGARDGAQGASAAVERRAATARNAAEVLGAQPPRFLGLPDNRLDEVALLDVVQAVEAVIAEIEPEIVYTHNGGDPIVDHYIAHS